MRIIRGVIGRMLIGVSIGLVWSGGGGVILPSASAWPLTEVQQQRLQTYIPGTYAKLKARQPVYIVTLGDSVTAMYTEDKNKGNSLRAFHGHFASRLAREFFYPGGVRVVNPPDGQPEKLSDHLGDEILIENIAKGGRCALDVLQRTSTDAFLNDPDLVIVQFGINDAIRGVSQDAYRTSLEQLVNACKSRKVDLIIAGPSLAESELGLQGMGLTRTFATVAREVAESHGLLFVDLGRTMARQGGGVPAKSEPEAAAQLVADRVNDFYRHEGQNVPGDLLHPNIEMHKIMGENFAAHLIDELPAGSYSINALGKFVDEKTVEVQLSLRNQTREKRSGFLGTLPMAHFLRPTVSSIAFELNPGENKQFKLTYERFERSAFGTPDDGGPRYFPAEIGDANLRLSYLVVDEEETDLIDVVTRLQPVGVKWTEQRFLDVTDAVRLEWQFVNGTDQAVRGKYRIGMGTVASEPVPFNLSPLGVKKFQAKFPFAPPPGTARIKYPLFLEVDVGGSKFMFRRELEAVHDIVLGEKVALSRSSTYQGKEKTGSKELDTGQQGVVMRVDADASALFVMLDFEGLDFLSFPNMPSLQADILIDAREAGRVRSFGFVNPLTITTGQQDGPGTIATPQLAMFGDGYNRKLFSDGFSARLGTFGDASKRRLEVRIPREYLFLHEWQIGSPQSVLGLNVKALLSAIHSETGQPAMPPERRFVHASPLLEAGATIYYRDARGLATLRLTRDPVSTWTAWIY